MQTLDLLVKFAIFSLAIFRCSHLLVREDGPFDLARNWRSLLVRWQVRNSGNPRFRLHWVIAGFHCIYCVSFWVSFAFAPLLYYWVYELELSIRGWLWTDVLLCAILALALAASVFVLNPRLSQNT